MGCTRGAGQGTIIDDVTAGGDEHAQLGRTGRGRGQGDCLGVNAAHAEEAAVDGDRSDGRRLEVIGVAEETSALHGEIGGAFDDATEDAVGALGQGQRATRADGADIHEGTRVRGDARNRGDRGDVETNVAPDVGRADRRLRANRH